MNAGSLPAVGSEQLRLTGVGDATLTRQLILPGADAQDVALKLTRAGAQVIEKSGGVLYVGTVDAQPLALMSNNTARFVCSSDGTFQIGGTTAFNLSTTGGVTWGAAADQKQSWWGATPVVQPTAVADATDAASAITQLNALLARCRTTGFIAT
jgi:hypothetical protein